MPKFSRRKGKSRSFLAKKKIRNTRKISNIRKIRGGNIEDAEMMNLKYKNEVTFKWISSIDDSKINIANNIAKARFHIENIIVKKTVELASAIFNEINNTNTPISKLLNLHEVDPLDELNKNSLDIKFYHTNNDNIKNGFRPENGDDAITLRIILYNVIQRYYIAINNGNKIMNKLSQEDDTFDKFESAISSNDFTKETAQHAIDAIEQAKQNFMLNDNNNDNALYTVYKDELVITTSEYIPDIVRAMNAIFNLFINIPKSATINNINVTPEEVGDDVFNALVDCKTKTRDNVLNNISESKDKYNLANLVYFGIYEIPVFFSEKTYKLFEYRLKLLHSLSKFEDSYIKLVDLIMNLKSDNDNTLSLGGGSDNETRTVTSNGNDSDSELDSQIGEFAGLGTAVETAAVAQPPAKGAVTGASAGSVVGAGKGASAGSVVGAGKGASTGSVGAATGKAAGKAASAGSDSGSVVGAGKGTGSVGAGSAAAGKGKGKGASTGSVGAAAGKAASAGSDSESDSESGSVVGAGKGTGAQPSVTGSVGAGSAAAGKGKGASAGSVVGAGKGAVAGTKIINL